jgi:hypothetical protein
MRRCQHLDFSKLRAMSFFFAFHCQLWLFYFRGDIPIASWFHCKPRMGILRHLFRRLDKVFMRHFHRLIETKEYPDINLGTSAKYAP